MRLKRLGDMLHDGAWPDGHLFSSCSGIPSCGTVPKLAGVGNFVGRFLDSMSAEPAIGSGVLIRDNLVLTARHVVVTAQGIHRTDLGCVFLYFEWKATTDLDNSTYKFDCLRQLYEVAQVVWSDELRDLAVLKLNRCVENTDEFPTGIVPVAVKRVSAAELLSALGTRELISFGYQNGLPLVYADNFCVSCPAKANTSGGGYNISVDLRAGISGGPIFVKPSSASETQWRDTVIGVVTAGEPDWCDAMTEIREVQYGVGGGCATARALDLVPTDVALAAAAGAAGSCVYGYLAQPPGRDIGPSWNYPCLYLNLIGDPNETVVYYGLLYGMTRIVRVLPPGRLTQTTCVQVQPGHCLSLTGCKLSYVVTGRTTGSWSCHTVRECQPR